MGNDEIICKNMKPNSCVKKSVTFSHATGDLGASAANATECLQFMRKGTSLIKLHSNGRQYRRTFYLDESMASIRWLSASKRHTRAQIHITEIRDVRLGCSVRAVHSFNRRWRASVTPSQSRDNSMNSNSPNIGGSSLRCESPGSLYHSPYSTHCRNYYQFGLSRATEIGAVQTNSGSTTNTHSRSGLTTSTLTITYGPEFDTLELLANSSAEANIWVTGLKFLMAGAQDPFILAEIQKPRDKWLSCIFHQADQSNSGCLSDNDVVNLIRQYNPSLSVNHLRIQLKEHDRRARKDRGQLNLEDFIAIFKKIVTRPEIYHILVRYASGLELLSVEDLTNFLEGEQGWVGLTREKVYNLIETFEPSAENRQLGFMGIDGFTAFLLSPKCDIFDTVHLKVCQDMSQPLTHYYLAASHKTFLLEDQLSGPCSVEGYQRALLSGCRYIEIEVHDGCDGHPVVRRTNAQQAGIPIHDALTTINDYAFMASEYPLVISVECYASPYQQYELVDLLCHCFNTRLLLPSSDLKFTLSESQLEDEDQMSGGQTCIYRKHSVTTVDLSEEQTVYTVDGMHVRFPSPRDLIGRILLCGQRLPKGNSEDVRSETNFTRGHASCRFPTFVSMIGMPIQHNIIQALSDLFFFDIVNYSHLSNHMRELSGSINVHSNANKVGESSVVVVGTHYEASLSSHHHTRCSIQGYTQYAPPSIRRGNHQDRSTSISSASDKLRVHPYRFIVLSESEACRALHATTAGDLVKTTRQCLIKISPSPSRVDSNNVNPVDLWTWGSHVVPLNYQTAGLVMDLATGFFARNGACGYVLKPSLYRRASSFFSPCIDLAPLNHQTRPPDTTPQILRLKLLSAQQLPKPRESVSKGETIEPYVVVEVHGIPLDCAEQRTRTARPDGTANHNATFDETFEFCVHMGSLALVRFLILDDHAIGDDFIGQNTIPFDCLLSGYRHVRLRSYTGEPIPMATLFLHVTIINQAENTQTTSSGLLHRWRSHKREIPLLKKVNHTGFDNLFKEAASSLRQAVNLRSDVFQAFEKFRHICGATSTNLSMSQCISSLVSRLTTTFGDSDAWPIRMRIRPEDDLPHMELQHSAFSPKHNDDISGYPSLSNLSNAIINNPDGQLPSEDLSSIRNLIGKTWSPSTSSLSSPGTLHRPPPVAAPPRVLFSRRHRVSTASDTRSVDSGDTGTTSTFSIDISDSHTSSSGITAGLRRRPSIQSSLSSISSVSLGGLDKMKRTVTYFEAVMESAKTLIKQGPFLRAKLQHVQRTAMDMYINFLESVNEATGSITHRQAGNLVHSNWSSSLERRSNSSYLDLLRLTRSGSVLPSASLPTTSSSLKDSAGSSVYWRRVSRTSDHVTWNLRLLTGQADLLTTSLTEINHWLIQAKQTSTATKLLMHERLPEPSQLVESMVTDDSGQLSCPIDTPSLFTLTKACEDIPPIDTIDQLSSSLTSSIACNKSSESTISSTSSSHITTSATSSYQHLSSTRSLHTSDIQLTRLPPLSKSTRSQISSNLANIPERSTGYMRNITAGTHVPKRTGGNTKYRIAAMSKQSSGDSDHQ